MSAINLVQDLTSLLSGLTQQPSSGPTLSFIADNLPAGVGVGDTLLATVLQAADLTALLDINGQAVPVRALAPSAGTQFPVEVSDAAAPAAGGSATASSAASSPAVRQPLGGPAVLTASSPMAGSSAARQLLGGQAVPRFLLADSLPANLQVGDRLTVTVRQASELPLLVDLNNQPVQLRAMPLLPNSTLTVRVRSLGPQPTLEVLPAPAEESPLPGLQVGATVPATVGPQTPSGGIQLTIQGVPLEATVPPEVTLEPGTQLTLRVAQTGPKPVFDVVDQQQPLEPHLLPLVRAALANPAPPGETLANLHQALREQAAAPDASPVLERLHDLVQALTPDPQPHPDQIASWLRDGGQLFEAKLAQAVATNTPHSLPQVVNSDLKGLLLSALADAQSSPSPPAQATLQPILGQLEYIEAQQAVNVLAQLSRGPVQLQIPVWNGRGLTTAALSIEPDGGHSGTGQEGPPNSYNLLFMLDLDGLGPTRIDAHVSAQTLRALFYVRAGEPLQRVQAGLADFQQNLEGMGYREVLLDARPLERLTPDKQRKFQALASGVPDRVTLVDVRV